jgi:hypothetical protein
MIINQKFKERLYIFCIDLMITYLPSIILIPIIFLCDFNLATAKNTILQNILVAIIIITIGTAILLIKHGRENPYINLQRLWDKNLLWGYLELIITPSIFSILTIIFIYLMPSYNILINIFSWLSIIQFLWFILIMYFLYKGNKNII